MFDQIFAYFIVTLFAASVLFFALSGLIIDWLSAREDRKKDAAQAAAAIESAQAAADRVESVAKLAKSA